MRVALQPAYILYRRPYRETSLLLELLTPENGRFGLVARGARAPRSRLRASLQPFQPLLVSWTGRGELGTLVHAEAHGVGPRLGGRALLSAWYATELIERLIPRYDPYVAVFQSYHQTLQALAQAEGEEQALRRFEQHLLQEIGYGLVLDHDVQSGEPIRAEARYDYRPEHGPVLLDDRCRAGLAVRGSTLLALQRGELNDAEVRREAKRLMRETLALYLGGKPLHSRALFQELAAPRAAPAALQEE